MGFVSDKRASLGGWSFDGEDSNGEMRGEPDGAEKQYNTQKKFSADGDGALQLRLDCGDINRGGDEDEHGAERHGHDEDRGENGSEDSVHGVRVVVRGITEEENTLLEGEFERGKLIFMD
jgi:hypothetical protein